MLTTTIPLPNLPPKAIRQDMPDGAANRIMLQSMCMATTGVTTIGTTTGTVRTGAGIIGTLHRGALDGVPTLIMEDTGIAIMRRIMPLITTITEIIITTIIMYIIREEEALRIIADSGVKTVRAMFRADVQLQQTL